MKQAEAGAKAAIDKAIESEAEGMRLKMLLERERRGRGTTEVAQLEQTIWDTNLVVERLRTELQEVQNKHRALQQKYGEGEQEETVVWRRAS